MISGLFKKKVKSALVFGALLVGGSSYAQLGLTWSEMGPNDIAGRCRSIIIDKTVANGSRLYAAGVSGGVFTSTNSASTWMPVNDQSASLIISCMNQGPDGTIYAGTGETYSRGGDGAGLSGFIGTGLYKFTPGTNTLVLVKDSSTFGNINEVAVDPNNALKIYVAGDKGFFASVDGGTTFFKEVSTGTVAAMDVKVASDGGVYFASGNKASQTSKVFYSPTGALATYTNMAVPSLTTAVSGGSGRIEIAVAPSNPNYVYVSVAKSFTLGSTVATGGLNSVWVSNDKGVTWKILSYGTAQFDPLSSSTTTGFGDYCHTLVVDPTNASSVFLGGYTVYNWKQDASLAFGLGNWVQIGNEFAAGTPLFVHPKAHDVKFLPSNPKQYYIATDGGIYKTVSLDNATYYPTAFLSYNNGLNISQFNSVAFQNFPKNIAAAGSPTANPAAGAIGGTIGNGACYLPGNFLNSIQTSVAFGSSDSYQTDFSKMIPKALFLSTAFGSVQRTSDIGTVPIGTFYDATYLGGSATTSNRPGSSAFANENTPMRLWENYGLTAPADYAIFYNSVIKNSFVNIFPSKSSFTIANTRPQSSAKYDTVTITGTSFKGKASHPNAYSYTVTNTTLMSTYASMTNTSTSQVTFTVANTRSNSSLQYASIIVNATPTGTNTAAAQSITIFPVYTGGNITNYSLAGTTSTNCAVFLNPSLNDSIRFTFDLPPDNPSFIEAFIKYVTPTTFTVATTRPAGVCRYDSIFVQTASTKLLNPPPVQTFTMIPSYDVNGNPTSYSFMGTDANTTIATNNMIFQDPSLTDSIRFTFNTALDDSSSFTVKTRLKYAQSLQIIPVYTGNNITSCNVIGQANTTFTYNNYVYPLSSLTDSIRFTFATLPDDSTTININVKLRYDAGSYITTTNTDISGHTFKDSLLLASTLYWNKTPIATVKIPLKISARLAVGVNGSIFAVKRPLNFSINPDWVRIVGKNSRIDGPGGVPSNTVAAMLGTVTKLEWAPDGRSLYFSTKVNDTTYYVYRTSHLDFLGDSASADYSGFFSSDLDSVGTTIVRKTVTQRTTPLGKFKYPITSISVKGDNSGIIVTTGGYKNKLATVYTSNGPDVRTLNLNNTDNTTNFSAKNGTGLPLFPAYSSLFEMNDNKRVLIGTEAGIYSTTDITQASPVWVPENNGFPNVPVFQIRQQTVPNYLCYNSGEIYVATHGRGIWSTNKYLSPFAIGINEQEKNASFASNIHLYPNPAGDNANVWFNAQGEASYKITVYDVSGRVMIQENTPKLQEGEQTIAINTSSLTSGVYFVSVNGTNSFNANVKFVISK